MELEGDDVDLEKGDPEGTRAFRWLYTFGG